MLYSTRRTDEPFLNGNADINPNAGVMCKDQSAMPRAQVDNGSDCVVSDISAPCRSLDGDVRTWDLGRMTGSKVLLLSNNPRHHVIDPLDT